MPGSTNPVFNIDRLKSQAASLRVLYVDDDKDSRERLALILSRLFKNVDTAVNGEEGLGRYIAAAPYDLVITDIRMPKMDGLAMTRKIRELEPEQEIIIVTAHNDTAFLIKAIELSVDAYILKPIVREQLMQVLDKTIQKLYAKRSALKEHRELERRVEEEVRKNIEKSRLLEEQSRLAQMGEMIIAISHEWKQPLNIIALLTQDLLDAYHDKELDEPYLQRAVDQVDTQLQGMAKVINQFQTFFKPDQHATFFHLATTVRDTAELMRPQLDRAGIGLSMELDESLKVNGFEGAFRLTLFNLLKNALDALTERAVSDPKVHLVLFKDQDAIQITVQDNAGGVETGLLTRIFEPYFSTKAPGKGTGIGLYMAKTTIEKHMGGRLWVSNSPEGAQFHITIPLKAMEEPGLLP